MSLLEKAKALVIEDHRRRKMTDVALREGVELAVAFIRGEVREPAVSAALECAPGAGRTILLRLLRDGVAMGLVSVEMKVTP